MNPIVERLTAEFGPDAELGELFSRGWKELPRTSARYEPKAEYRAANGGWPRGFAELLDGRIVFRTYYGGILLAPAAHQLPWPTHS